MSCEYNLFADANAAGECTFLEKQVAELQASEAGLKKSKGELEDKLQQLEELLASTTATRDELQGGLGGNMQHCLPTCYIFKQRHLHKPGRLLDGEHVKKLAATLSG